MNPATKKRVPKSLPRRSVAIWGPGAVQWAFVLVGVRHCGLLELQGGLQEMMPSSVASRHVGRAIIGGVEGLKEGEACPSYELR